MYSSSVIKVVNNKKIYVCECVYTCKNVLGTKKKLCWVVNFGEIGPGDKNKIELGSKNMNKSTLILNKYFLV